MSRYSLVQINLRKNVGVSSSEAPSYRGLIYDRAILSTAYSVKMVVVGMNDQCGPYLVPYNFNMLVSK